MAEGPVKCQIVYTMKPQPRLIGQLCASGVGRVAVLAGIVLGPWAMGSEGQAIRRVLHDETFAANAWRHRLVGGQNVTSVQVYQEIGTGVTGNAQRTTVTGSSPIQYDVRHYQTNLFWTPALDGEIVSIEWQLWYKVMGESTYGILEMAASQGGAEYIASGTYTEPVLFWSHWQMAAGAVPISAYTLSLGSGPQQLDFSPWAPPITFGYRSFTTVNLRYSRIDHRVSFFDLQINAIPQPPILITDATKLANQSFRVSFMHKPGGPYRVQGTSNLVPGSNDWTTLGSVTEVSPGQYQFDDLQTTNGGQRFYRIRCP